MSKCYEIKYSKSTFRSARETCYVIADTPEEAAVIFKDKKYWQWVFRSLEELGIAFDKNSDRVS